MEMKTSLRGRLRNTELPYSHGLAPLFEAIVNSIHAIDARGEDFTSGRISVLVCREPQTGLGFPDESRRGAPPLEPIKSFIISDNGEGFDETNYTSFQTLDSEHKARLGCRGVGRLLWLKAFDSAIVESTYKDPIDNSYKQRNFKFGLNGVEDSRLTTTEANQNRTIITLEGFKKAYREKSPKSGQTIATALMEHCLWYFVRDGGAPDLDVVDADEIFNINKMFESHMHTSAKTAQFTVSNNNFEITHLKLKANSRQSPALAWCAAGRVVREDSISGKLPGLFGKLTDADGEFLYAGYLTSKYLDEKVRPERTEFLIPENGGQLGFPDLSTIRAEALKSTQEFLGDTLQSSVEASQERVATFVREKAPRYRTVLKHVTDEKLAVDPEISDKELDLILHKQLADLESNLISEGHEILKLHDGESTKRYKERLSEYLSKVDDVKKSDLADYVFHRKIVLDVLRRAIEKQADDRYAREDLIHEFIMPMRKDSNEIHFDQSNLWLLDERLAFHDYLASDKPLSSLPITNSTENKEPDIVALNVFDEPILVSDKGALPLGSIVVIELKRPMRNDAKEGEDKDPITQALGYLDRIRKGQVTTSRGRPIPRAEEIPGFCYIVCDITTSIEARCRLANLTVTADRMGFFGYNDNYKSYIEVMSYDRLLKGAEERNRAFFSKLGLPHN
ncbi:ATP-binding protein [Xanthomonas tesorieronis]|uniref:ATP-binding protein n=1 Tax=Xanthomonas tesorieronis TaxID=3160839 RepID=UPI00351588F8